MAADLEAIMVGPDVIGVVDHPCRQPQRLALDGVEKRQPRITHVFTPRSGGESGWSWLEITAIVSVSFTYFGIYAQSG